MSVLVKLLPSDYSPIVVTTYSVATALVVLTPFVLPRLYQIHITEWAHPSIFGGLLYLGVVSTAGGFLLWNRGLQMLNASIGGIFFFFQPLVGAILGWLILGESIGISFWIGSILILAGVLFIVLEKK